MRRRLRRRIGIAVQGPAFLWNRWPCEHSDIADQSSSAGSADSPGEFRKYSGYRFRGSSGCKAVSNSTGISQRRKSTPAGNRFPHVGPDYASECVTQLLAGPCCRYILEFREFREVTFSRKTGEDHHPRRAKNQGCNFLSWPSLSPVSTVRSVGWAATTVIHAAPLATCSIMFSVSA